MSINPNNEEGGNLTPKFDKAIKFIILFKNYFKFSPKIIIVLTLVSLGFLGSGHISYGSDGIVFHKINSDNFFEQPAKTSDNFTNNLENYEKNEKKFPDYEVKTGDTISAIAEKYDLKISAVLQANNLTAENIINPGQKLILPVADETLANLNLGKTDFQTRAVLVNENNSGGSETNTLEDDNPSERKPFDYEVERGDTVSNIAERYNLKINTILWANNLTVKSIIQPGQKLVLLPVDGVLHKVEKGDIIGKIAALHKADAQKIQDYNDINDPTRIYPGDMIIVPDGQPLPPPPKTRIAQSPKPPEGVDNGQSVAAEKPVLNTTDKLLWPTPAKKITQGYWTKHRGIDIANGGTPPIFASHSGTVEFAGKSGDWGNTILLRRDDGLVTRYSHASEIYVAVGQTVNAGDTIAQIGTTGRSTGNHLDFRVYINGVAANPLKLF